MPLSNRRPVASRLAIPLFLRLWCRSYISQADVLDERSINLALVQDLLQQGVDNVVQVRVLETALLAFREGCADREGNHNVIGVLLRAGEGWCQRMSPGATLQTYMAEIPVLVGERWERREPSRWEAMVNCGGD